MPTKTDISPVKKPDLIEDTWIEDTQTHLQKCFLMQLGEYLFIHNDLTPLGKHNLRHDIQYISEDQVNLLEIGGIFQILDSIENTIKLGNEEVNEVKYLIIGISAHYGLCRIDVNTIAKKKSTSYFECAADIIIEVITFKDIERNFTIKQKENVVSFIKESWGNLMFRF